MYILQTTPEWKHNMQNKLNKLTAPQQIYYTLTFHKSKLLFIYLFCWRQRMLYL